MEDIKDESADIQNLKCQEKRDGWQSFFQERPLRVLLVEDDLHTRQVVRALLSNCGYEVSTATDGASAWVILEGSRCKFDLVLADAMMPFVPGFDLLSKIVKSKAHGDIPVIMMSAQDSMDVVLKCLLKGAKDFLVKPLRRNELRNLWQHVWRRNHLSNSRSVHGNPVSKRRKIAITHGPAIPSSFLTEDISQSGNSLAGRGGFYWSATEVPQHASETRQSQLRESTPAEDSVIDHMTDGFAGISTGKGDSLATVEGNEALERSAKAMDLIGTMMSEPVNVECLFGSPKITLKDAPGSHFESALPSVLELTLKGSISVEADCFAFNAMKGLKHSKRSAFSTYSSHLLPQQYQQCFNSSASLPSQFSSCDSSNTLSFPRGDGVEITSSTLALPAARFKREGSSGLSTLYFPEAIRLCKYESDVNSELSLLASCDSSGGKKEQSKDLVPSRDGLLQTAPLEQEPFRLCAPDAEVVVNDGRSPMLESTPITPCDSSSHPDSTRLFSNIVTSKGSSCVTCKTGEGGDCSPNQLNRSLEDFPSSDVSSVQNCNELVTAEQRKNHSSMILSDGCGPTFREAALQKFRQKRKIRCFDKKVRYQSRKQLADQRPRVKGQFVRQAVYDASMATAIN